MSNLVANTPPKKTLDLKQLGLNMIGLRTAEQKAQLQNQQAEQRAGVAALYAGGGGGAFEKGMQEYTDKLNQSNQLYNQGQMATGQFGFAAGKAGRQMFQNSSLDKINAERASRGESKIRMNANGQYVTKGEGSEDVQYDLTPEEAKKLNNAGMLGSFVGENTGNILSGALEGSGAILTAESAAKRAGAMQELQNEKARTGIMSQAQTDIRDMNAGNAAQGMQMTDNAIAQDSAFEAGMEGIDSSGIEGSGNMERNLQFRQDQAEAAQSMQFDAMGNAAQDYENSMAKSFGDLSNMKAAAMNGAASATLTNRIQTQEDIWRQSGQNAVMAAPGYNDIQAAVMAGEDAAQKAGLPSAEEQGKEGQSPIEAQVQEQQAQQAQQQAAQTDPPPPAVKQQIDHNQVFDFYSKAQSNDASQKYLADLGLDQTEIAQFDAKMAEFGRNKDREGRRKWTAQFFTNRGGGV